MPIDFTESELRKFSPRISAVYVRALMDGKDVLAEAGILDSGLRLSHFLGQCAAESAGLTTMRESLKYSATRAKQVFPKYFRGMSTAEVQAIVADQVKFADTVYGGRMGNRKGTRDAYDYRGSGFLQVTGRNNWEKWTSELGIDLTPEAVDDPDVTLKVSCAIWQSGGCNEFADADNLLKISRVINVGNANSTVTPNGLADREDWTEKARAIWGNAQPVEEPEPVATASTGIVSRQCFSQLNELADQGSRVAGWVRSIKRWFWGTAATATGTVGLVNQNRGTAGAFVELIRDHPFWAIGITALIAGLVVYATVKVVEKFIVSAARDGRYKPRGAK